MQRGVAHFEGAVKSAGQMLARRRAYPQRQRQNKRRSVGTKRIRMLLQNFWGSVVRPHSSPGLKTGASRGRFMKGGSAEACTFEMVFYCSIIGLAVI